MKLHRINADHWQLTSSANHRTVSIGRATTAGQINAAAHALGLDCQQMGQVITVICSREPHDTARQYGIRYEDRRTADLAELMQAIRAAKEHARHRHH